MFYIYTDAYFSSEFIIFNFLHMFVLPDVASSGIAGVRLLFLIFFYPRCSLFIHCNIAYHILLQILLCVFL